MSQAFRLSRGGALLALALLFVLCGVRTGARAQTVSATPDSFVLQITQTTPTPTPSPVPSPALFAAPRNSFAADISGDGRFVVIESNGDIGTKDPANGLNPDNSDGNVEIFLFDYAQRRTFQITNTRSALKDQTRQPDDPNNIDVIVVNLQPTISRDGRFIVFKSNAYADTNRSLTPKSFNGNDNAAALRADGNTEIFYYEIPAAPGPEGGLSSGAEAPLTNLTTGAMTRVTVTPARSLPRPGGATNLPPFFSDDNRAPAVNDDASYIAFVSVADIPNTGGVSNADGNPEIFVFNRTVSSTGTFTQATDTRDIAATATTVFTLVFNDNPSLSGCTPSGATCSPANVRLAFASNADINSAEADSDRRNGEVYVANFNGTAVSNVRPITRTPPETRTGIVGAPVNVFSPGRRLSRDGNFVAFESTATNFNADGTVNGGPANAFGLFVYNIGAGSFTQVAARPADDAGGDLPIRFPVFTGDSSRLVFSSNLNLRPDGTVAANGSNEGLNPNRQSQVFTAPVAALTTVSRLTRTPSTQAIQPVVSDTVRRLAFSLAQTELGGGNPDNSSEAFYLLVPEAGADQSASVSFSTGASDRPVVAASPTPTPPAVTGLAPGMLGIARTDVAVATSSRQVDQTAASERRRPALPVELNGVSVSISGAAAGLYFVGPNQINFVVPPGLSSSATALPLVIRTASGAIIRTTLLLNPAQPDIATSTNGAGGRAAVFDNSDPMRPMRGEPFTVPTQLTIMLTGVRNVTRAQVTVRIKDTDLSGDAIVSVGPSLTPGFDQIVVNAPASLAGAGDSTVVVTVTINNVTFTSRPAETAPRITIN